MGIYLTALEGASSTATMSSILTDLGTFFSQAMTWVGNIVDTVVSHPILMLSVFGLGIVGFAFGCVGRLVRL